MSAPVVATQQPMLSADGDGTQISTQVTVQTAEDPVSRPSAPSPPEKRQKSKQNGPGKGKKPSNSDAVTAPAGTMLTYLEPVLMRPAQHRVKAYLKACSDSLLPTLSKQSASTFEEDVYSIFAYNLQCRMDETLEDYVPQGFKHNVGPIALPWTICRLVDAYSAFEPDKGVAPPLLPDRSWIMTDLHTRGIVYPTALELNALLARWMKYEKEISKDYPNVFVVKSGDSLLSAGVIVTTSGNIPTYNVVARVRLSRSEELMVGFLRSRKFECPVDGVYLPVVLNQERRSIPSLAGYYKAAEAFDEQKFVFEFLMTSYRRA